ncbi:MAG: DUF3857 domain-containing protein [Flavipsychrobacter sp.]
MNRTFTLLAFIALSVGAHAQDAKVYEWEPKPTIHKIPAAYSKESAVIIEDDINIEYRSELQNVYVYRSVHRVVKVLDETGIEAFNKVTIPMSNGKTIEFIKARTILPNGKIIEIGRDKVKEIKNEDGDPQYLFAMEGVEKNAEVELQYTEKKPLALFGAENFQFGIPVMHATFSLSTPQRMVFQVKGYNGFGDAKDTLIDDTRYYKVAHSSIPALHDEPYGDKEPNQMRVEYKLNYLPNENPDKRMLTWNDLARQLYKGYYNFSSREKKAVEKYLDQLELSSAGAEQEKIQKIEEGIKTNIVFNKDLSGENATQLDKVIANKTANEEGYARLFAACFTMVGVAHEFGLSSNRFEHPFDEHFENWNYLESYVFYFPNTKKFLAPSYIYYRYPVVPASLIGNKGIFSKITDDDAIADIRDITPLPIKESENNIIANISFNADLDPQVEVTHTFSGYSALGIRDAMVLLPKDKQKEAIQNIVNLSDKPEDVLTYKTANSAFHNYYDNKPLKLMATLNASQLMEKAGPKYLFKLGDVIGRQQEMYQDVKRELPISIPFPHAENRTITVTIPTGYKILNPEAIRIHQDDKDENKGTPTMGFDSDYKIDGDKLYVNIKEYYSGLSYPVSYYETFRKVINASADFNKVVLVLVKQ